MILGRLEFENFSCVEGSFSWDIREACFLENDALNGKRISFSFLRWEQGSLTKEHYSFFFRIKSPLTRLYHPVHGTRIKKKKKILVV